MLNNKVKFFLDTEFIELGRNHPLELLSIGIVAEDGHSLYLENRSANFNLANNWVRENVFPNLKYTNANIDYREVNNCNIEGCYRVENIAQIINNFIDSELPTYKHKAEFWGYFCDYDWVIFCQLFGTMVELPKGFPYYCNDLKQLMKFNNIDSSLVELTNRESNHNALDDAKQIKEGYDQIMKMCY